MDKTEARVLFDEADRLYKSGSYIEALQHLSELRQEFPNHFNVLYPLLLCREKLGRIDEACGLCNEMMAQFTTTKHRDKLGKVYARLMTQKTAPPADTETLPGNEYIKDEPYRVEIDGDGLIEFRGRWLPWKNILFGAAVVLGLFVFIAVLPFMLPKDEEGVVQGASIIILVGGLLFQYVLNCVVFYVALWATNKLLHEDLVLDIIDVCIFAPIFGILAGIPIIGWGIGYFILADRYDMGLWDLLAFIAVFMMVNIGFAYLLLPMLFGPAVVT